MTETIIIAVICLCILVLTAFNIILTTRKNEAMLQVQIQAAKLKKTDHITTLKFNDILEIINNIINFYVSEKILELGIIDKKDEELSIMIDSMIVDVSTDVTSAMSEELTNAIKNYISDKHLKQYIVSTIRLSIVARIQEL